jgi:oligopeptide/dipeptide ABC transporter ATP-binding protein
VSTLLEVEGLTADLPGGLRVLDGISFSLAAGRALGLVGESGCGKTTAALSILRLLPPGSRLDGSVTLLGERLLEAPEARLVELRGSKMAMVFQEPLSALNPVLTIGSQIAETLEVHARLPKKAAHARATELLGSVGIAEPSARAASYAHQLSGGMRQRVLIAAALACEPRLLIADEPTTALDVTVQAQILALLTSLKKERGLGLLLITHDLQAVAAACDDVAVMYSGRIVERGPVAEIFERPAHPYTQALLKARPSLATRGGALAALPGQLPPPGARIEGCRFKGRCSRAIERCAVEGPVTTARDVRAVECWNPLP